MIEPPQRGFTLVEVLIALTISSLVIAGAVSALLSQQKLYSVREDVMEMQQNARMGLDFMVRELAMAGYDPSEGSNAGIVAASATMLQVSMDLDGDGSTTGIDENVSYGLYDDGGDGDLDLGRTADGATQLIAENVESLAFEYTLADDSTTPTPADPSQIRAVAVSLATRAAHRDPHHAPNGGYRTRTLRTTVHIKNMGL